MASAVLGIEISDRRTMKSLFEEIYAVGFKMQKNIEGEFELEYFEQDGCSCINRRTQAKDNDKHLSPRRKQLLCHKVIGHQNLYL